MQQFSGAFTWLSSQPHSVSLGIIPYDIQVLWTFGRKWNFRVLTWRNRVIKSLEDYHARQLKKLDLKDNVIVVFYLYGLLILMSLLLIWHKSKCLFLIFVVNAFVMIIKKPTIVDNK